MTTIYPPVQYPIAYDSFLPRLIDNVDDVLASHPNTLLEAVENLQAKLGIDNDPVQGLGGVCFDPAGKAAYPGSPGVPGLWVDSLAGPGFILKYTDDLGATIDLGSGLFEKTGSMLYPKTAGDYLEIEIPDNNNTEVLKLIQKDVTNNPNALIVENSGTGTAIYLQGVGSLSIGSAALLALYDVNKAGSTYASDFLLSSTFGEWDTFESNLGGEYSLIGAFNELYSLISAESLWDRAGAILSPQNLGDGVSISTIDDTSVVGLQVTQNDSTNNPAAVIIENAGSGTAIYLQGAGSLSIGSSALLSLYDANKAGSGYADDLVLSDASSEWDEFETNYGEVSLIAALNNAGIFQEGIGYLSSQRRNAGMNVSGIGGFSTGFENTIETDSIRCVAQGYRLHIGLQGNLCQDSFVFGQQCTVFDATSYFGKPGPGGNVIFSPVQNGKLDLVGSVLNVITSPILYVGEPITDCIPQIGIAEIDGDLYEYSAWTNAGATTPNGEFTLTGTLSKTYLIGDGVKAGALNMGDSLLYGGYNFLNDVGGALVIGAYNVVQRIGGPTLLGVSIIGANCTVSGDVNFAGGFFHTISGNGNFTYGQTNTIAGDYNLVLGMNNSAPGNWQFIFGEDNFGYGEHGSILGDENIAYSENIFISGNLNVVGTGANGSAFFGNEHVVGSTFSATGFAKATSLSRGGTNLTAAGNTIGNAYINAQNTVLGGSESMGAFPVRIVGIADYFCVSVTDTPNPIYNIDTTLGETSGSGLDITWGNITGLTAIIMQDEVAPLGLFPPQGLVRIGGDDYLYTGFSTSSPGLYILTGLDRPLDHDYTDADIMEFGNLENSPIFWSNEDTTVLPPTGFIDIDGDVYEYNGTGAAWPGLWGIGLVTPLTRDYDDGVVVTLVGDNKDNFVQGYQHTIEGLRNAVFGTQINVTATHNIVTGFWHTVDGNYNAVFGNSHEVMGDWNTVGGYNHSVDNGDYNIIGGNSISVTGSNENLLAGYDYEVTSSYYNIIGGISHSAISGASRNIIGGGSHAVTNTSYNIIAGYNSTVSGGSYNAVFGTQCSVGSNPNSCTGNIVAGSNIVVGSDAGYASHGNALFGSGYDLHIGNFNIITGVSHAFGSTGSPQPQYCAIFGSTHTFNHSASYSIFAGSAHVVPLAGGAVNNVAVFGTANTPEGSCATIGGSTNYVHDYGAAFGYNNTVLAYGIAAGEHNAASGHSASFGKDNVAISYSLSCGLGNYIDEYGFVCGSHNRSTADHCIVSGSYSSISWPYSIANSSSSALGDSLNTIDTPLGIHTTDDSWTDLEIISGYADYSLILNDHSVYLFDILVLATRKDVRGETKSWNLQFTATNEGNVITIDTPVETVISNASVLPWDIQVVSYGPSGGFYGVKIQVKGENLKTVYWQASVRATEISTVN